MTQQFRKTYFTIDEEGHLFEGYTTDKTWNGWECPFFTLEVGMQLVEHFNSDKYPAYYDANKDTFVFCMTEDDNPDEYSKYSSKEVEIESVKLKLYPIGAFSWIWDEATPEELQELTEVQ